MTPQIARLFFYPIKSFRGIETRSLRLDRVGPQFDRQWMLVDKENTFITQRTMPELAKIGVNIFEDAVIELSVNGKIISEFGLDEKEEGAKLVKVWKDEVKAFEVSKDVSKELSDYLSTPVRLVRISEDETRPGRFADGAPIMIVSEESLRDLEKRSGQSLAIARFRPNILITDCGAYDEDRIPKFSIGKVQFEAKKPCTRCKITTIHPLTGEVGEEPLKTLATYRQTEKGVAFGHYFNYSITGSTWAQIDVGQKLQLG